MPQIIRIASGSQAPQRGIGDQLGEVAKALFGGPLPGEVEYRNQKAREARRLNDYTESLAARHRNPDPNGANDRIGDAIMAGISGPAAAGYDLARATTQPGAKVDDPAFGALQIGAGKGAGDTFAAVKLHDNTTRRGQDVNASTQVATNAATNLMTARGQDLTAETTRRGQDMSTGESQRQFDMTPTNTLNDQGQSTITPRKDAYGRPAPEGLTVVQGNAARNQLNAGGGRIPAAIDDKTGTFIGATKAEATPEVVRLQAARDATPEGSRERAEINAAIRAKSISAGGEGAYDKKVADAYAETDTRLQSEAIHSTQREALLDNIGNQIRTGKAILGPGSQYVLAAKQLATMLGVSTEGVPETELIRSLGNKLVLDSTPNGSLGAQISNADREFLAQAVPGMANSAAGNIALIDTLKAMERRKRQTAGWLDEYKRANGGRVDGGFRQFLQQKAEAEPLFPRAAPTAGAGDLRPGYIEDGFEFTGGDPTRRESWRPVR